VAEFVNKNGRAKQKHDTGRDVDKTKNSMNHAKLAPIGARENLTGKAPSGNHLLLGGRALPAFHAMAVTVV
jgi:hypothetical protein